VRRVLESHQLLALRHLQGLLQTISKGIDDTDDGTTARC
jgi:hypothetical protein